MRHLLAVILALSFTAPLCTQQEKTKPNVGQKNPKPARSIITPDWRKYKIIKACILGDDGLYRKTLKYEKQLDEWGAKGYELKSVAVCGNCIFFVMEKYHVEERLLPRIEPPR